MTVNIYSNDQKMEPKDSIWYDKQCIGKTTVGAKMKEISLHVQLSKIYTNPSGITEVD